MYLPISVGALAAVMTCIIDLLLVPFFEACRNKLVAYAANRALSAGQCVVIGRSNPIMKFFGVGSVLKVRTFTNFIGIFFRISLKILLLLAVIVWESQLTPSIRRDYITRRLKRDPDDKRSTTLLTPLPLSSSLVGNETCQNQYSHSGSPCVRDRFVRFDPDVQTKFSSECVELISKQVVVYYALAEYSPAGPRITCLNGKQGSDRRVFMLHNSVDSRVYPSQVWNISKLTLRDDGNADDVDGPYRSTAIIHRLDGKEDTLDGYITFAGRTHNDNNVQRSAYGVFVSNKNGTVATASIAVAQAPIICNGQPLGTWHFGVDGVFCPDGTLSFNYPERAAVFELGLKRYDVETQNIIPFTPLDALIWIFETPIARFSCPVDGAAEMRMRYSVMDLFFYYNSSRTLRIRAGGLKTTTELDGKSTVLLVVAVVAVTSYSALSAILFWIVSRRNLIYSDFDDPMRISALWRKGSIPKYRVTDASKNTSVRLTPDSEEMVLKGTSTLYAN